MTAASPLDRAGAPRSVTLSDGSEWTRLPDESSGGPAWMSSTFRMANTPWLEHTRQDGNEQNDYHDVYDPLTAADHRAIADVLDPPAALPEAAPATPLIGHTERARAIAGDARVIVDTAKAEVAFLNATGNATPTGFMPTVDSPTAVTAPAMRRLA